MFVLEPARTEQHYEALLELIYHQQSAIIDPLLDLIELTRDQFGGYFRTTGVAYRIYLDGNLVGLCWVQTNQSTLQLLGLIIRQEYQNQGLGSQALAWLEDNRPGEISAIELQVYRSNRRAMALYARHGYQVAGICERTGFYSMRKDLQVEKIPA